MPDVRLCRTQPSTSNEERERERERKKTFSCVSRSADRAFPQSTVSGTLVINVPSATTHQGITMRMDGSVQLQLSAKSVGLFEAFYNSIKPVQLVLQTAQIAAPGKLKAGVTELPFEFKLEPLPGQTLYETYHGVFVNIQYQLSVDVPRGMLAKNLVATLEFLVEKEPIIMQELNAAEPVPFEITPASLENVKKSSLKSVPDFKVVGSLDRTISDITQPFTGHLAVIHCAVPIKSIELQLVRVETCGCADGYAKEATEIQNIQLADGDILHGLQIPIFMIFPRLFTCPTLATRTFKTEFEINIVIIFDGVTAKDTGRQLVSWNVPIKIVRAAVPSSHMYFQ